MVLKSMQRRGRLQKGMFADIVVFDPKTVKDNSTLQMAWKPTTGMAAVIVNGTVVARDDRVLPLHPGKPICFDRNKPRIETSSGERWREQFMVGLELPGELCMAHPDSPPEDFK
jgi:N-acyl-D-glutamate deacylase